ncbi:DUF6445 family protein [Rossellomorea vietnamensis]|uniref:DUF6445 family protein n=1 Tax=Rossellomorea vietnamensis TaxID=218284 RepID=A0ACD4CDE7_9BACI|nr:DUF6445 family protein [Rossellomorea vietnamensis]UXH46426.1 DUF6445 family protein [Rossellomorea vietnamensis]
MEKTDLIVVDDFYDNPYNIRNLALEAEYLQFVNKNVPGFESKHSFYNQMYKTKFSKYLERDIEINPHQLTYGKFRYSLRNSESLSSVHLDKATWSAIVYLTLDEHCEGGLGVYKHMDSGLTCVPAQGELNKKGYSSIKDLDQKVVYPDTNDMNKWELIEFVPMKFNRLVLLKGSKYFHSVTEQFGDTRENARLSHNFFFNEEN